MLPHRFPFRFVDRPGRDLCRVLLSSGSYWNRGSRTLSLSFAIEILAQAAVMEMPGAGDEPAQGLLAGIQGAELEGSAGPGDLLEARTELLGRFGGLAKIRGSLRHPDGRPVATAELLLALQG